MKTLVKVLLDLGHTRAQLNPPRCDPTHSNAPEPLSRARSCAAVGFKSGGPRSRERSDHPIASFDRSRPNSIQPPRSRVHSGCPNVTINPSRSFLIVRSCTVWVRLNPLAHLNPSHLVVVPLTGGSHYACASPTSRRARASVPERGQRRAQCWVTSRASLQRVFATLH